MSIWKQGKKTTVIGLITGGLALAAQYFTLPFPVEGLSELIATLALIFVAKDTKS